MTTFAWGDLGAELRVVAADDAPVVIGVSDVIAGPAEGRAQALVELVTTDAGLICASSSHRRGVVGEALRYVSHEATEQRLVVVQRDDASGLETWTEIAATTGAGTYRCRTTVTNVGDATRVLEAVSSISLGGLTGYLGRTSSTQVWTARNEQMAENRWSPEPIADLLPDINPAIHRQPARGVVERTGETTWPTGRFQPGGVLVGPDAALAWEIEHNGPWRWEVGSLFAREDWLGLILMGPTALQHGWSHPLAPGESFTTVPATVALGADLVDANARLTAHRRATHGPQPADASTALIYNDYMNTLMGDPTTEKLEPLIDAVAEVGADVFCIDAGWYDEGGDWWPSVGRWEPSVRRFGEGGLARLLERIRARGMRPGLWLEPEVIGVRSDVAAELPDSAFMTRGGARIASHDRYFLDLTDDAARAHVDATFDRVIGEYGAEYIKWDYNVTPGAGPDPDGVSPGAGLLAHHRALQELVEGIRERHPHVILESCASGAMRQDRATLSLYDLQSTSDQQDARLYPPIAAGAGMAMPLEQAGNWAYPHWEMNAEEVAFALVTGLAGRMYLSGYLDRFSERSRALVAQAAAVYRGVIRHHRESVPMWPLGLPGWSDEVVASGSRALSDDVTLACVWSRADAAAAELSFPHLAGAEVEVVQAFPAPASDLAAWETSWDPERGALEITGMGDLEARLYALRKVENR
ncbi:glycoside hydrolase family 36 protein [Demequina sp. NBRC 110054]|uniref:glycoside hydrolase family 36 protein n=1 Tax=Demequina sp. NBRC 110054 TaxID=1570343 RepID=UPI0013564A23|nr:glycoside hydrolase family 36 protein [Demequina sp. NBRC 110054]